MPVKKVFFSVRPYFVRALVKPTYNSFIFGLFRPKKRTLQEKFYVDQLFHADTTMQSTETLISYLFFPSPRKKHPQNYSLIL